MATQGLWNIGPINLPDFGITEKINQLTSNDNSMGVLPVSWNNAGVNQSQMSSWAAEPITQTVSGAVAPTSGQWSPAPSAASNTPIAPSSPSPAPSGGSGGSGGGSYSFNIGDFPNYTGWNPEAARQDWLAKGSPSPQSFQDQINNQTNALRGEISSGYDQYLNQLTQMMEGLPNQAQNMNQIIGNQYTSGIGDLTNSQNMGLSDLGAERASATQNQNRNLKDIANNIKNMFMSGNVYLGSRGAGDSSAANQYSYALTKVGNKARGDVMSQTSNIQAEIGRRESTLKQTVANEMNKLGMERDNKMLEVAQWLQEQQNSIRDRIGQVGVSKSTDLANLSKSLLDQAMQRLALVDQDSRSRASMLQEWAVNQSKSIGELKQNLAGIAGFSPQLPQASTFNGTPQISGGNYNLPINWSSNTQSEERDIFGNPIRR